MLRVNIPPSAKLPGRVREAKEPRPQPWDCPGLRFGPSCLTLACIGLSALGSQPHIRSPILRIIAALGRRPEILQNSPLPSVLAVPSLLEKLNVSSKVQIKGCLPGKASHDPPHPTPAPSVDLITSYPGSTSLLSANVITSHVTQRVHLVIFPSGLKAFPCILHLLSIHSPLPAAIVSSPGLLY